MAALSDHAYYLACGTEGMRELGLERVCSFRFQGHNTITTTAIERDVTVLSSTVKKELRAMISWPAVLSIHTQCCISSGFRATVPWSYDINVDFSVMDRVSF